jgi:hypothetical protein
VRIDGPTKAAQAVGAAAAEAAAQHRCESAGAAAWNPGDYFLYRRLYS